MANCILASSADFGLVAPILRPAAVILGEQSRSLMERAIPLPRQFQPVLEKDLEKFSLDSSLHSEKELYIATVSDKPLEGSSFYHLSPPRQTTHQNSALDPLGLNLITVFRNLSQTSSLSTWRVIIANTVLTTERGSFLAGMDPPPGGIFGVQGVLIWI